MIKKYQVGDLNPNDCVVKVSELKKEIMKHMNCKEYHKINGKRATCLDVIYKKLGD